mgnify:CR=1 FL=1
MDLLYALIHKIYHRFRAKKIERYFQKLIARGLSIGQDCILPDIESVYWDVSHCYLISIGNHCGIASNVRFIAHDGSTKLFLGYTKFARIAVKDNTMIGDSAMILPGVTIGPNAIVRDAAVGDRCRIEQLLIEKMSVPDDTTARPGVWRRPRSRRTGEV